MCFLQRHDALCIDVDVSFFGFPSHIVYYAVLIRGPCWLFLYVHLYLLISHCPSPFPFSNHEVALLCCEAVSVWKEVPVYPFLEFTSKSYHMTPVFLCLTSLIMTLSTSFLVADGAWCYPLSGWVILFCVPSLICPFMCPYPLRLLPCPGCCSQCCHEHWDAPVFSKYGFLWIYAQKWDCWVLWYFSILFLMNLCSVLLRGFTNFHSHQ